jgi:uncharacterized membrane protein (UPF0182 family)
VRSPADLGSRSPASPRRRIIIIVSVAVLIVLLFSLRSLAVLWTDYLWFSSVDLSYVWSTVFQIKIALALVFGVVYFVLLFSMLLLTDRLGARDLSFDADDEIVRRFQDLVRPYSRRIYAGISVVAAIFAGLSATGQWQNYLLFANAQSFHRTDPLYHKDIGFYVFKLPFYSFIVSWLLGALVSVIIITAVFHYLNGGIRTTRVTPRVSPQVKVHLSVLLAVVAIVKAAGYIIARWHLVTSTNGYTEGAGYADVHARIPALTILFWLSLAAAAILLVNIRNRGWSLPLLAVGLWAFVALVIGVIYPALLQAIRVTPAQSTLELPYIQRNITATRDAYDINTVAYPSFAAATTISPEELRLSSTTMSNIRLWDPSPSIALETVQRRQAIQSYYQFTSLGVDRYFVNGHLTPILIGARQLNSSTIPSPSWVNSHLVYTHGVGMAALAANTFEPVTGNPIFNVANIPPQSTNGMPQLTVPGIYFGINLPGWVVANTKQKELDYQINTGSQAGTPIETHYQGTGGVAIGGFFQRMAIALRFSDLNLLISSQITPKSRILFVRDVEDMANKAAPFISWDAHPYGVIADGRIKYILDGYTTSENYPYSQNASTQAVPQDSGLPSSYNYVRNSVKLVVDAYDGTMQFYAADPNDPILKAYRAAFPDMFQPMSSMPQSIRSHLRYPQDIFSIQSATIGRYHITDPASFYTASDRWEISPTTGAGSPEQSLQQTTVTNQAGEITQSSLSPMDPIYQVGALPATTHQQLTLTDVFVPYGASSTVQPLKAFVMATSDPEDYGKLTVYVTPRGETVTSPLQADSYIQQNQKVSSSITLLDQHGSSVLLGNILLVPLDNTVLYIRPFYVTSTTNPLPQIRYVIAVYDQRVAIEPSLGAALASVISGSGSVTGPSQSGHSVTYYLQQASAAYTAAQQALLRGDLAQYQLEVNQMNKFIGLAQSALASSK